jgi:hypothetical protein
MNGITRTHEEAMNTFEIHCPWCAGEATVEAPATQAGVATFVCTECLVRVDLAPDPAPHAVALAA